MTKNCEHDDRWTITTDEENDKEQCIMCERGVVTTYDP